MSKRRPNGEGMVRKIGKRWEGRIVVGHKTDGSPIFRYTYGKTQKELLDKMHQKMSEYHGVELNESSNMSLSEWLDLWLEKYMRSTVRKSTFEGYLRIANNYLKPYLGDKKIAFITADDIQKMYVKLKKEGRKHKNPKSGTELSDSTVSRIHMMLHKAMDDAVKEHLVPKNPTHGTIPPKRNKPQIRILNDEQLEKFMTVIENDEIWCDFFYTELTTGLRRGEICGIKWEDFNEDEGSINIKRTVKVNKGTVTEGEPKTGKGIRKIYLPQSTVDKLKKKKTLSHSEWMFENPLNPSVPLAPNSAYNRMRVLLKNAGLPIIRFHDLRHPYVKHTTKIFSLRLMDFQAQAYPDARRKTRGACQLLRVGQSRSPVRPLCNRKRFSCLPPQSKMSWILYAISMRLSGYTSTRSISSSASSVVSVSASKIALDAFLRLSCRACSSCFFFACANTAA